VAGDHLLLLEHREFLDGLGDRLGAHWLLHSLIESAKVPACSRIGCICPEFSAYLNAMKGMPASLSTCCSIGRSSRAGSQKLGAAKMTPSAPERWTARTRYWPFSFRSGSYLAAVDSE